VRKSEQYKTIRDALSKVEPASSHAADQPPDPMDIYTPVDHEAALDPERPLVVGGRGVGKSFWAGALLGAESRKFVSENYPRLGLNNCDAKLGFAGVDQAEGGPPSAQTFSELMVKDKFSAETIWRAVVLRCVADVVNVELPTRYRGVDGLVAWANQDSERLQIALRKADSELEKKGRRLVIVFDAIDRLGENWNEIRDRSRALLKVALAMKSYRAIKLKIFMRVDQADDTTLFNFPDASKLLGAKVNLDWNRADLYGLLFTTLIKNTQSRLPISSLIQRTASLKVSRGVKASLPLELKSDEDLQEAVFRELAGPYMGSDRRRGKTYSWIHNHLADAHGRVSPRSFLEAMRVAAKAGAHLAGSVFEPKGLQSGLQAASTVRVDQLREEFGWIQSALEPLADLRVPCIELELFTRWKDAFTIETIRKTSTSDGFLMPLEFESPESDPKALLDAMVRIGVAERRVDGRINVPDIYRVAAKLLRKGGVRPLAR
jgi:hypothetical protein